MSNKIKVSVIMGAFLPVPAIQGGAVEILWFELVEALAAKGIEVSLISKQHPDLLDNEVVNGVHYFRIMGFRSVNFMPLRLLLDFVYSFFAIQKAKGADVIITNSFWSPIFAKLVTKSKVWVSVHRFPRHQMKIYKKADVIQPVSHAVAEGIVAQSPSVADKICVIPNFVMKPNYQFDINTKEKTILYVGRLYHDKGLEQLIKDFSLINNHEWKLIIVGPHEVQFGGGGEEYLRRLKKNASENVFFEGRIFDRNRLNAYYKKASIFVYPSLASKGEAFPLSPLEAMSYGCICIVLDLDCFKDYITDEYNGFIVNNLNNKINLQVTIEQQIDSYASQEHIEVAQAAMVTAQKFSLDKVANLVNTKLKSII